MTTLFDPVHLGELSLPNRIVMAPMTRCRASEGRVPNALMADMVEHLSREKPIHTNKLGSTISIKRLDRGGVRNNDG